MPVWDSENTEVSRRLKIEKDFNDFRDNLDNSKTFHESINTGPSNFRQQNSRGPTSGISADDPKTVQLLKVLSPAGEVSINGTTLIVDHILDTVLNLYWLTDGIRDGQIVKLKPKQGKSLVLNPGGNINITSAITINDNQVVYLQLFKDTGDKYNVLAASGSGSGGGSVTNPLGADLDINKKLLINGTMLSFSDDGLAATPAGFALMVQDQTINGVGDRMLANLNAGKDFTIAENNVDKMILDTSAMTLHLTTMTTLLVTPPGGNPLSISKTAGQPAEYSSAEGHRFNQKIIMGAPGLDIADTINPVEDVFAQRLRLQPGALVQNKPMITSDGSDNLMLNAPSGKSIILNHNAAPTYTFGPTALLASNIILSNTLTFNNGFTDPASNGQLARNGNDLKVMSGGRVRNFSDMMENPAFENLDMAARSILNTGDFTPLLDNIRLMGTSALRYSTVYSANLAWNNTHKIFIGDSIMNFIMGNLDNILFTIDGAVRFQVGESSVQVNESMSIANGKDIIFNSSTGSKIGTASTEKLAFYGATPIARPSSVAVTAAGIHAALVSLGLIT